MAKKYTVKKTDNLLELSQKFGTSPSNILKVNGLQTLTPGQTINIPVLRGFSGVETGAGYETQRGGRRGRQENTTSLLSYSTNYNDFGAVARPFEPAYGGTYNPTVIPQTTSGGNRRGRPQDGGYVGFQTPTTNGFMTPLITPSTSTGARGAVSFAPTASAPFVTPPTNSFLANPLIGASLSGDKQGQVPALTAPAVSRAEGKAQFLSGEGVNPNSGYIPTRADVWNMKANARRKKMAKGESDAGGGGYSSAPAADPTLQNQGNYVNTAVSWRVG